MSKTKRSSAPEERASKRRKGPLSQPDQVQRPQKDFESKQSKTVDKVETKTSDAKVVRNGIDKVSQNLPSVKDLASSDWPKRKAAFEAIKKHLEQRPASSILSQADCLQIWRGFSVAVYMYDSKSPISVQNFIRDVAETFSIVASKDEPDSTVWLDNYHKAFEQTLTREWANIDSHRMNKYLLLVRFMVSELFKACFHPLFSLKPESTDAQQTVANLSAITRLTAVMDVLKTDGPLNCTDRKIADGLRLHLLDILPVEVGTAWDSASTEGSGNAEDPETIDEVFVDQMFKIIVSPVQDMSKSDSGAQKHVRSRAKEALVSLEQWQKQHNGQEGSNHLSSDG